MIESSAVDRQWDESGMDADHEGKTHAGAKRPARRQTQGCVDHTASMGTDDSTVG